MPAGAGKLLLFTQADETDIPGGESVHLNSIQIAGGEIFSATAGSYASLLTLPVTTLAGDNQLTVTTGSDWFGFHLAVLSVEGLAVETFTLDFETEDDFVTALGNGQALTTPPEFGVLASISSTGSNLGAATFDSTPGGPNSGTIDTDLLIGKGNILLLQDDAHPTQTVPGFFDTPVDDPNGGNLVFDLTALSDPQSVVLIDLDPEPNHGATVTLIDSGGRTRVYTVPQGWTGTYGGAPGWKMLDLTTTANQVGNAPGFRLATASQMSGFLQDQVARVVVHMTGPGAMDDLTFSR